jgi:hypothetical protein
LKKYSWLDDFTAHWPVDDVLRGNFNNRTSYQKDRDNGALARHRGGRKEGQGVDIGGEDAEEGGEEEDGTGWAGDGYDSDHAVEVENETGDEAEQDVQTQASRTKRHRVIGA